MNVPNIIISENKPLTISPLRSIVCLIWQSDLLLQQGSEIYEHIKGGVPIYCDELSCRGLRPICPLDFLVGKVPIPKSGRNEYTVIWFLNFLPSFNGSFPFISATFCTETISIVNRSKGVVENFQEETAVVGFPIH